MDLATISSAIALAGIAAGVLALVLFAGARLPRPSYGRGPFNSRIAHLPAQRWREAWQRCRVQRTLWLLPSLVLIIVSATLLLAEPQAAVAYPAWQQWLVISLAAVLLGVAITRSVQLTWQRLKYLQRIAAGTAIGQALHRLSTNRNRAFHDVPTAFGVVDHVIAGLHGVYAVKVVAVKPGKSRVVRLHDDVLDFGNGRARVSINHARKVSERLAREAGKVLGHPVHVRLVVAAPGWEVDAQTVDDVLLVNERNVMMLSGWKDERDYLMNEDVDTLHDYLDKQASQGAGAG